MRRVAVTGLGVVSSIGCHIPSVESALREGSSGLRKSPEMQELGLKCHVYGPLKGWDASKLTRRSRQTMSTYAQYSAGAALDAIADAGLEVNALQSDRVGIFVGTAYSGVNELFPVEQMVMARKSPSRAGLTGIVKVMSTSACSNLGAFLGIRGRNYAVSSSFASGLDNIGHAYEMIGFGMQDVCICGSAEEDCLRQLAPYFDNWNGMPSSWNDEPGRACRPYDRDREGFVVSSGAGILVLEALDHASRRGARIYAEVVGYGSSCDGKDLFRPTGEGLERSLRQALRCAESHGTETIDYINTHGTGTPVGDEIEVQAIRCVFGNHTPLVSSTKGLTGHGLGAAGGQEAVYTLLMLHNDFVAPTANLENVAPQCSGIRHVQSVQAMKLRTVMSFNVGLGGANSCVIFQKV